MTLKKEDLSIIQKLYLEHLGTLPPMIQRPESINPLSKDAFESISKENKEFSGELSQLPEYLKKAAISINKKSVGIFNKNGNWDTPAQLLLYEFMNWYHNFKLDGGLKHLHYAYAIRARMNLFKAVFLSDQSIGSLGLNAGINLNDEYNWPLYAYEEFKEYCSDSELYFNFASWDLPTLCNSPEKTLKDYIKKFIETINPEHVEKLTPLNQLTKQLEDDFRKLGKCVAITTYNSQPKQNHILQAINSIKLRLALIQETMKELLLTESFFNEFEQAKQIKAHHIDFFIKNGMFLALEIVQWHVENERGYLKNVTYPERETAESVHEKKFLDLLNDIEIKTASVQNTDKDAYNAGIDLHKKLNKAYKHWINYGAKSSGISTFYLKCEDAINLAKPYLQVDTDWDMILKNIGLAVAGLIIFYGIACLINKQVTGNFLFFKKEQPREAMLQIIGGIENTIKDQHKSLSGW